MAKLRFIEAEDQQIDREGSYKSPPFQCLRCGRFARPLSESHFYDGQGTQIELSWNCSSCGSQRMNCV